MEQNRPDVIQILEKEKQYHIDQIKRINVAIKALTDGTEAIQRVETTTRQVSWSAEISKLFDDFGELSFNEIRNKLIEKGITKAVEDKYRSTIQATVRRKVLGKELEQTPKGAYRRVKKQEGNIENDVPF